MSNEVSVHAPQGSTRRSMYAGRIWDHRTGVRCHRCDSRTDTLEKQDENGMRSADRNVLLCLECLANSRNRRNPDLDAAFNIL